MIILRQNNFSDKKKKMRWIDKEDIKDYTKNQKIREAIKKQYDNDPEIRKQGNKDLLKERLKGSGRAASIIVPGYAGVEYMNNRLDKVGRKESLKRGAIRGVDAAIIGSIGTGIGTGITAYNNKQKDKRVEKGELSNKDKKQLDKVKVSEGEMSKEDFINKWGK